MSFVTRLTLTVFSLCLNVSLKSSSAQETVPTQAVADGPEQGAHDKRMKILVVTQADSVAREYPGLSQRVLSYMLTKERIEDQRADFNPVDQVVLTSEMALYSETRVRSASGKRPRKAESWPRTQTEASNQTSRLSQPYTTAAKCLCSLIHTQ